MQRHEALEVLSGLTNEDDLFVSSIGGLKDDWWNLRPGQSDNTFSHGALGSHSSTGLGLAIALPHRRIVVLETDGSILMNTGVMCTLGNERPPNLTVIVIDNEMYESVGRLPTHTSGNTDLARMAEGAGCINCTTVTTLDRFEVEVARLLDDGELGFLVAKIEPGVKQWPVQDRKPTDGVEDKYRFIRYVEQLEGIVIHPGTPSK